jgi:hypothetical protein
MLDQSTHYVERTLRGTFVVATAGRATLNLLTGTSEAAPTGIFLDGHRSETADFKAELPAYFGMNIDAHRLEADPIRTDWRNYMDDAYGEAVFVALPRLLPADPVGRGARWQVVARLGDETRTVTWEVSAIDGGTVTLTGRQHSSWLARDLRTSTDVRSAIDFANFSVDATVELSGFGSHSSALTTGVSKRHEVATVSIKTPP